MAVKTSSLPFLRQYDKLIAIAVLIVLVVSLFYLTSAGTARQRGEADFIRELDSLRPSSGAVSAMDLSAYESALRGARSPLQLEIPALQQAGFLTPEQRVYCVSPACKKPIPYAATVCPFCQTKQPLAPELNTERDSDNDGIPDRVELALGLNPQDAADAKGDLDGDGFSNLEEFLAKTDPKDPKSHPAIVNLLRVKELHGKRLPFAFSAINKMPDGKMQLTFEVAGPMRRTLWIKEGSPIGDTGWTAVKVEVKFEDRDNPKTPGHKMRVDVSTVVVKRMSDNKEVTLRINEVGKNTDVEAVVVLPLDSTEYMVLENAAFKVREETYRVISIDSATTSVVIENTATGQQKVVHKLD